MTADLRREEIARIANEADRHWLDRTDTGVGCSCGDWFFALSEAHPQIEVGDHFLPFSKHVATALYDEGLRSQDTATARIAARIENRATNLASAYWQKGEGHRERLRKDMAALHGRDYMVNTFARIDAIVAEELRAVLSGETRTDGETDRG